MVFVWSFWHQNIFKENIEFEENIDFRACLNSFCGPRLQSLTDFCTSKMLNFLSENIHIFGGGSDFFFYRIDLIKMFASSSLSIA